LTCLAERDVELSAEHADGIESCLAVPDEKDVVCRHVQTG
jgi:hypothetical protein